MKNIENESMKGLTEKPKPSSETFKVPDGFFDDFPDQIISGTNRKNIDNSKFRFNRISIAAVLSALAITSALIYQQVQKKHTNNEPSVEDLVHFLVLEGASHEELAQQLIPDQIDDQSDESQTDKIYETYLLEQEVDINHINEEL